MQHLTDYIYESKDLDERSRQSKIYRFACAIVVSATTLLFILHIIQMVKAHACLCLCSTSYTIVAEIHELILLRDIKPYSRIPPRFLALWTIETSECALAVKGNISRKLWPIIITIITLHWTRHSYSIANIGKCTAYKLIWLVIVPKKLLGILIAYYFITYPSVV